MLIEYKPFEPAFYHTDIGDWGMASHLSRAAGPQARVLVDTGHHYNAQNIEQIVSWLLHTGLLGGFHFNDRRYADDDLTLGSIDPYQIFRIFHELSDCPGKGPLDAIAYMIDQSHNIKGKIEATIQTVVTAQELWLKASLIDREQLVAASAILRHCGCRRTISRRILDRCSPACRRVARGARTARQPAGRSARRRLC